MKPGNVLGPPKTVLEALRRKSGISATSMARTLGLSPCYYSAAERGERGLSAQVRDRLATVLGLPKEVLAEMIPLRKVGRPRHEPGGARKLSVAEARAALREVEDGGGS